jgi:hypothetical protein
VWHCFHMRKSQCKFGCNGAVTKGTLLSRPKLFFLLSRFDLQGVYKHIILAHPPHARQSGQVCSKSGSNKGHFTLEAGRVFRLYLDSLCSGVSQILHVVLPPNALKPVKGWSNRERDKGNFTLMAEIFFVPMSLRIATGWFKEYTWPSLQKLQNEWKFCRNRAVTKALTLEDERVSRACLTSHCRGVTQTSKVTLPPSVPQPAQVWSKSDSNMRPKGFLLPISPLSAAGWLKQHTWHWLHMRQNQCKFGWKRTLTKGTLLLRQKQFLVAISSRIPPGRLKHHSVYSLQMFHNQCKFRRNRVVTKGNLPLRRNSFSSLSCASFQLCQSNIKRGISSTCSTKCASLVEIEQ